MKLKSRSFLSLVLGSCLALSPTLWAADEASHHESHAGHMLEGYAAVSQALFEDNLEAAQKAATAMAEHDEESALAGPATKIAQAKSLEEAREAFKELSAEAVKVKDASEADSLTVMKCPMVKGGGGIWLSADGKVNNPYFGSKMPHCGGPMKK